MIQFDYKRLRKGFFELLQGPYSILTKARFGAPPIRTLRARAKGHQRIAIIQILIILGIMLISHFIEPHLNGNTKKTTALVGNLDL